MPTAASAERSSLSFPTAADFPRARSVEPDARHALIELLEGFVTVLAAEGECVDFETGHEIDYLMADTMEVIDRVKAACGR